jgi:hypothetical protein
LDELGMGERGLGDERQADDDYGGDSQPPRMAQE